MNEPQDTQIEQTTTETANIKPGEVTQEQLDAVTARLDAYDRQRAKDEKRARNRRNAENAPEVRVEPEPPILLREDHPDWIQAVVSKHTDADDLGEGLKKVYASIHEAVEPTERAIAHLGALVTGLEYGSRQETAAVMAVAFNTESKRIVDAHLKRYDRVTKYADSEIAHLEKQAELSARAARAEITTSIGTHIAQEIRAFFRQMPPTERMKAVMEAAGNGDKETLSALLEPGVPRYLLGITKEGEAKSLEAIIERAERRMAPKHVARKEAALDFARRLRATRDRYHQGSERLCMIVNLEGKSALAGRIQSLTKTGAL